MRRRIKFRNRDIRRKAIHTRAKKKLDLDQYDKLFPFSYDQSGKSIREKALDKAWKVRDFEIELYWKRATYFWAFIASSFVAYFASINSDFVQNHFIQLEYLIICIGFVFSVAWALVNIGSKNWQKNWEGHIDRLEDNFTGPLYKTVKKTFYNFSVSRINIYISLFTASIWVILAFSFYERNHYYLTDSVNKIDPIISTANIVTIFFVIVMLIFGKTGFSFPGNKTAYKIREIK